MNRPTHHVVSDGTVRGTVIYSLIYDDPVELRNVESCFLSISSKLTAGGVFRFDESGDLIYSEMVNPYVDIATEEILIQHLTDSYKVLVHGKALRGVTVIGVNMRSGNELIDIDLHIVPLLGREL